MALPDDYVTCPLDEAHRIVRSRLQYHLVRCLKNHKLDKKLRCPWNATHIIDKFAYEDHWRNKCEDLPEVMGSLVCSTEGSEQPVLASLPVTTPKPALVPADEDWDAQPSCGTYNPMEHTQSKAVFRTLSGLSKSERKKWIKMERERHQQLENEKPVRINKPCPKRTDGVDPNKSLRAPREPPIAMSANCSMLNNTQTSNIDEEEPKLSTNLQAPSSSVQTLKLDNEEAHKEKNIELPDQSSKLAARSRASSISSNSCDASLTMRNSNKSFASVASIGTKNKENSDHLQNDYASFPVLSPTGSKSNKVDHFINDQLSGQIENLVTMIKDTEKENIAHPKLIDANLEIKDPSTKAQKSVRKMLRCAANFDNLNISEHTGNNPVRLEK